MNGTLTKVGERYLLRTGGKQLPVILMATSRSSGRLMYKFVSLINGESLERTSARALSKHYDNCYLIGRPAQCQCREKLQALALPESV